MEVHHHPQVEKKKIKEYFPSPASFPAGTRRFE